MYRSLFLGCLVFIACGDSPKKKETHSGGKDAAQASNSDGDGSSTSDASKPVADAADEAAIDPPPKLDAPTPDYQKIAEEACRKAGGECLLPSDNVPENARVEGLHCTPGYGAGVVCARRPAECEGYGVAYCCEDRAGVPAASYRAGCDRGYPTCLTAGKWLASSQEACATGERLAIPAEAAPSKWAGAISVTEAAKWACDQAGGQSFVGEDFLKLIEGKQLGESICPDDGYAVGFHFLGMCCIPKTACPETNPDVECCKASGGLEAKGCNNGRADCDPITLGTGLVKEVKAGTCKPYSL